MARGIVDIAGDSIKIVAEDVGVVISFSLTPVCGVGVRV